MSKQAARLLLALLLLGECPERLVAADCGLGRSAACDAASPEEETCYAPIAIRYRDEAVRTITTQVVAPAVPPANLQGSPEAKTAHDPEHAGIGPLADLDPVFAFKSLQC